MVSTFILKYGSLRHHALWHRSITASEGYRSMTAEKKLKLKHQKINVSNASSILRLLSTYFS